MAPAIALIAVAAIVLLVVTLVTDLREGVAIALSALLAIVLVREVVIRLQVDLALSHATTALKELSAGGDDADRSVTELLDGLTQRLCGLLRASWSAVSLTNESGELAVVSAAGDAPVAVGDVRDGRSIPRDRSAHQLAVPLALGESQFGVAEVGSSQGRRFSRTDHELLRILADHLATSIERARLVDAERRSRLGSSHARAHLTLLSEISIVLARALEDPRPALRECARIIAGTIADACAIHLTRSDGTLEGAAVVDFPLLEFDASTGKPYDEFVSGYRQAGDALRRVMETGTSELTFIGPEGHVQGTDDSMAAALRASGMRSWVVAPIRVRGLAVGTIVVATSGTRRGLRESDRTTIDEIAGRMAIVIERSELYQETRRQGAAAERRAAQLSSLIEATIALNRSLRTQELLDTLVEQASRILEASTSSAWLTAGAEATLGRRPVRGVRIGSTLVGTDGERVGYLSVERDDERPFTGDEQALLLLLSRLASVALQNARLYDDLSLREQRLSALFAASPLAILELDLSGTVRELNPAARKLFAADEEIDIVLPDALRQRVSPLISAAVAHEFADAELSVEIADDTLELWVSTAPLRSPRGAPEGVLMVISDTTARKRLEEQLIESHRYEAIAQLAGGVAHDFNNLLTIIVGYSDLALRAELEPQLRDELTAVNEAGQLAAVITNQLLMLSRRQILKPVVVSLASACESLIGMLRRLVGNRVTIESRFEGDAAIKIDQGQLEQILFNLVLNGRDAMVKSGTITISTALVEGGYVEDGYVSLHVTDTGQGMDAETIARCRQPFFTTKGRRGIGLGLATVASIVERAGGRLDIDSEVGHGTTITVEFPVAADVPVPEGALAPRRAACVVVVDDDELIRRYAAHVLTDHGYEVVPFGDAESALAWVDEGHRFDLLVSDVVLPGLNGFELARAVEQRKPGVPRLLMTGFAGTDTSETDLATVEVLSKPFSIDEFLKSVSDSLGTGGQGSKR